MQQPGYAGPPDYPQQPGYAGPAPSYGMPTGQPVMATPSLPQGKN